MNYEIGAGCTNGDEKLEAQAEADRKKAWKVRFEELAASMPKNGSKFQGYCYVRLEKDPATKMVSAYCLLRPVGRYPVEPYFELAGLSGRFGLKVFLNKASRDWLEIRNHRQFIATQSMPGYIGTIAFGGAIKILDPCASGRAVYGEICH